jgi:hypothetical protein
MEFLIKLILFIIFGNWWIAMNIFITNSETKRIKYIALAWAIAFSVIVGFIVIP